jgi:flagellar biosynthesis GTPase FlhF
MKIHRVRGRDLREALSRAQQMLGASALVLSSERGEDGGVTLSVGAPPEKPVERLRRLGFGGDEPQAVRGTPSGLPVHEPALREVRRRMKQHGCSSEWVEALCGSLVGGPGEAQHPIDAAARLIPGDFKLAPAPRPGSEGAAIALVGPTGVGKTTTLAKLAERLSRSGRRVVLASLDRFRAGAFDQLRAFAERLELPFIELGQGPERLSELAQLGPRDVLLVDTTGRSPKDRAALAELADELERLGRGPSLAVYLVQSAAASRAALLEAHRAFASLEPSGLVITKLDESGEPGQVLDYARLARLPLAFLCDGQELGRHLHRPRAEQLADLVLRGRLP